MKVRTSVLTTSLIAAALLAAAPAHADIIWLFAPQPGGVDQTNLGAGGGSISSPTYASGGIGINVTGFSPSNTPINIFEKIGGGDETGLGLNGEHDSEVNVGSYIQFDLLNVPSNLTTLSFLAGSATTGVNCPNPASCGTTTVNESFTLIGSNTAHTISGATTQSFGTCTNSGSNNCEQLMLISGLLGTYRYLDVVGNAGDILVQEINAQTVPGPIVGAGLPGLVAACGGLLALARRRRTSAAAA
jgi:hypothetical protein